MRQSPLGPIYLSARFARRDELRGYRDELVAAGFVVTSSWLDSTEAIDHVTGRAVAPDGSHPEHTPRASEMAVADIADVRASRVFIAFTDEPGVVGAGRGGRHVELGLALAVEQDIFVVGPREHVFHWHPLVTHCETWRECLAALLTL